jgi:putative acetyltransferase
MEIQIRRSVPSDVNDILNVYSCPNAYTNTLQLPHPSVEAWTKRVSNLTDNNFQFVAIINDEVFGNIGFEIYANPRRRHVGSFGMGVKDNYQGVGVGSALLATVIDLADKWFNLKRLELSVYTDNERAISLYKKFGFEIEGESKDYAFRDGQYVSVYHMARIV